MKFLFYGLCLIWTKILREIHKEGLVLLIFIIWSFTCIWPITIIYKVHEYIISLHHGRSHIDSNLAITWAISRAYARLQIESWEYSKVDHLINLLAVDGKLQMCIKSTNTRLKLDMIHIIKRNSNWVSQKSTTLILYKPAIDVEGYPSWSHSS